MRSGRWSTKRRESKDVKIMESKSIEDVHLIKDRQSVIARLLTVGNVSGSCTNAIFEYLDFIGAADRLPEIVTRAETYGASQGSRRLDPLLRYPIAEEMSLIFAAKDVLGW